MRTEPETGNLGCVFRLAPAAGLLAGTTTGAWAAARTTAADGNWSADATWGGAANKPQAADDATVAHNVTLDVSSVALNSVTINEDIYRLRAIRVNPLI